TDAGLLLCALVFASMGLALAIGDGVGMGRTAVRVLSILGLIFAALTTIVIFIKIVNPPGQVDLSLKIGPFLALFASLVADLGAAIALMASTKPAEQWTSGRPAAAAVASGPVGVAPAGWYSDP